MLLFSDLIGTDHSFQCNLTNFIYLNPGSGKTNPMLTTSNIRGENLLWLTPIVFTWLATFTAPVQLVLFFL